MDYMVLKGRGKRSPHVYICISEEPAKNDFLVIHYYNMIYI